jgi:1,4-dihydroxy-2-naphthoate octaprenyltransferase
MNIFLAIIVYLIMAAVLVAGLLLAIKGDFWLLILGLVCYVLGLTRISILTHH